MNTGDVIVIGGGLVGTAVAYGLASSGARVIVLDGGDDVLRASRGNFGLVWVQGKGFGLTPYARWTRESAELWPMLAKELLNATGIDVHLEQPGGFNFCYSETLFEQRRERLQSICDALGGDYPFEMLDHAALKARLPEVGPGVFGASFMPMDGQVNPLAEQVGLHAPVIPLRGQVMVSERVKHFLDYPTLHVRQTDEGTVQIGDSHEDVGYDDSTTTDVLTTIARRGVTCFPLLAKLNLVRAWGALRVMSPDGFPIYQESRSCPGAFVTTCHSGVTLTAAHAFRIAPWVAGGVAPQGIDAFAGDRFLNQHRI